MKKRLLFALALAVTAFTSSMAIEKGDKVYTSSARYQIVGDNILTNGSFNQGDTNLNGWYALADVDGAPVVTTSFTAESSDEGFNIATVTASTADDGMYASVATEAGVTYIVSMKIRNLTLTTPVSTSLDTPAASSNYLNVLAGASLAEATSYGSTATISAEWNEVCFEVPASDDASNIYIKLAGMADGFQIAEVKVMAANAIYDPRTATNALNAAAPLMAYDWESNVDNLEPIQGLQENYEAVTDQAKEDGLTPDDGATNIDGLNESIASVLSSYCEIIADTTSLTSVAKVQKGSAIGSWTVNCDGRGFHTASAAEAQLGQYGGQYNIGAWSGNYNKSFTSGDYYFSMEARAFQLNGTSTKLNTWTDSNIDKATQIAQCRLYIGNDTTEWVDLKTMDNTRIALMATITSDMTDAKIGFEFRTNENYIEKHGGSYWFSYPKICKVIKKDQLTDTQLTYLANVQTQVDALKDKIATANGYLSDATTPWGRELLQEGITEAQKRYDYFAGLSQKEILQTLEDGTATYTGAATSVTDETEYTYTTSPLVNVVMNAGVRFLQNSFMTPFLTTNAPLTNLAATLANAKTVIADPFYAASTMMSEYQTAIDEAQTTYDTYIVTSADEDGTGAAALEEKNTSLAAIKAEFKNAVPSTEIVNIDFNSGKAEQIVDETEGTTLNVVKGSAGEIVLPTYSEMGSTDFNHMLIQNATETDNYALVIGNGGETSAAYVVVDEASVENKVEVISFDMYCGRLTGKSNGIYFYDEDSVQVTNLVFSPYDHSVTTNPLNIVLDPLLASTAGKSGAFVDGNKTHFDFYFDNLNKVMKCVVSSTSGETETSIASFTGGTVVRFAMGSDYANYEDRRSMMDNIVIKTCDATATAISNVKVAPAVKNGKIYNLSGVEVKNAAKGVYIMNGKKYVK